MEHTSGCPPFRPHCAHPSPSSSGFFVGCPLPLPFPLPPVAVPLPVPQSSSFSHSPLPFPLPFPEPLPWSPEEPLLPADRLPSPFPLPSPLELCVSPFPLPFPAAEGRRLGPSSSSRGTDSHGRGDAPPEEVAGDCTRTARGGRGSLDSVLRIDRGSGHAGGGGGGGRRRSPRHGERDLEREERVRDRRAGEDDEVVADGDRCLRRTGLWLRRRGRRVSERSRLRRRLRCERSWLLVARRSGLRLRRRGEVVVGCL